MKHLQQYKKNLRMKRRLIKKNYRNSRIENSRIARSRIDLVYVTKNISSKTIIIWSKKFVRSNQNRTKKSKKKKSTKSSKRIRDFESQSNTLRKKSRSDLKKTRKSRTSTMNICKTGKRLLVRYRTGSRVSSSSARVSLESSCPGYSVTVELNSRHQLLQ
jgi:hypothetical protein